MKRIKKKLSIVLFLVACIYCSSIYRLSLDAVAPDYEKETSYGMAEEGDLTVFYHASNDSKMVMQVDF